MMGTWQMVWDDGDIGSLINNIIPKVSLQPFNWTRNVLFFTGHGPFPSYLHRFNFGENSFGSNEEIGTPVHYATECLLTASYGTTQPTTSASLVLQGSQQFNVKKEDPQFAPPSPK
ncbi:hypothetical protein AVEN_234397-1 [Araneus ventricosus]|uniref:Uncharacterized protein n=1 Tax=Araneus ventricosus TaxID=182803 RepID=A0A4Y2AA20_ARAVE|nr:hypothetical protein AVEN_234397-1 [Araneus ventricosus]